MGCLPSRCLQDLWLLQAILDLAAPQKPWFHLKMLQLPFSPPRMLTPTPVEATCPNLREKLLLFHRHGLPQSSVKTCQQHSFQRHLLLLFQLLWALNILPLLWPLPPNLFLNQLLVFQDRLLQLQPQPQSLLSLASHPLLVQVPSRSHSLPLSPMHSSGKSPRFRRSRGLLDSHLPHETCATLSSTQTLDQILPEETLS